MEGELGYRFGGFISDLLAGNLAPYPEILFLARSDEGPIFRILTCESSKDGGVNVARLGVHAVNEPRPKPIEGACP